MSILSDRRIARARAGRHRRRHRSHAAPGFTVIATANLRDRGVSEMSAALKRRFNFETVGPIADLDAETALVAPAGDGRRSSGSAPPFARRRRGAGGAGHRVPGPARRAVGRGLGGGAARPR